MVRDLLWAWLLLASCVVIHSVTLTWIIRRLPRMIPVREGQFWPTTWLLVRLAGYLVLAHVAEVLVFATFYSLEGAFPDAKACGYFSVVTYTTVGYGDLVPPEALRLTAGVEGLTGILMCGWSTGFFFAVVNRFYRLEGSAR